MEQIHITFEFLFDSCIPVHNILPIGIAKAGDARSKRRALTTS